MNNHSTLKEENPAAGALCAFFSFLIWGLSPIYWRALHCVGSFEIILHRIIWSFFFSILLVLVRRQWSPLHRVLRSPKILSVLTFTAILVSSNWLIYIWAVNNERVLEASLGYYINPLVNILLGRIFLGERLRRAQALAVLLAATGVAFLTIAYGIFPWVSLALAFSFGIYGLIRKVADVGALVGLTVETLLLAIPAGVWVLLMVHRNEGAFLHIKMGTDLLLVGTGILTATPLLLFALGAKRITLTSLGFIQYTAPTGMFLLGITIFGESFSPIHGVTFGLIWTALAIYSWDMVRGQVRHQR